MTSNNFRVSVYASRKSAADTSGSHMPVPVGQRAAGIQLHQDGIQAGEHDIPQMRCTRRYHQLGNHGTDIQYIRSGITALAQRNDIGMQIYTARRNNSHMRTDLHRVYTTGRASPTLRIYIGKCGEQAHQRLIIPLQPRFSIELIVRRIFQIDVIHMCIDYLTS